MSGILWIVVASVTKPDPEEKLLEFYKLARPMVWWGPIAKKSGAKTAGHHLILQGLVVALTGTVMVASGIIGFSCLYVGRWLLAILGMLIAIFSGLIFRKLYRLYLAKLDIK